MNTKHQVQVYETKIETLDEMLSGGIPINSTVLITGRPGSGKTTLALQILAEAAKKNISTAFLTFDESPEKAFDNFIRSYPSGLKSTDYVRTTPQKTKYLENPGCIRIVDNPEDWMRIFDPDKGSLESLKSPDAKLERMFRQLSDCGIWFIDGVNVLLESIRENEIFGKTRLLQQLIRKTFIENSSEFSRLKIHPRTPNIVIFTAEASTDRREYVYESYLADVIISLKYRDFAPDRNFPEATERHLVCSIPKGRGIHVQRREVTYEFVPGKGIEFYPTYPASGMVSFFFENKRQKQLIEDFKRVDVPTLYPGLSVRSFHRSAILHEYAVRRRHDEIPKRYENNTSSLDEYWTRNLRPLLAKLPLDLIRPYDREFEGALIPEIQKSKRWLFSSDGESIYAVPYLGNLGVFFVNRRTGLETKIASDGTPYLTWEQIERFCSEASTSRETPQLCCEMKSIDSFAAFGLELCWSHNGGWYTKRKSPTDPSLEVKFPSGQSEEGIILALARLQSWIHEKRILRPYATLQPTHPNCVVTPDFVRHWYSTVVEAATDENKQGRSSDMQALPIPIPEWKESILGNELTSKNFHSCWGEWYLGAWKGTENIRLVTEIINTITSSRWQINTAITGAGLPIFEPFFEEFGNCRCFGTDLTFRKLRDVLYSGAISRGQFSEYRFVMQRFYAALMTIVANPEIEIEELWKDTRERIEQAL